MNMLARNWRDLIRPRGIQVEHETLTEFYGKFTCEPLERGYGITLGNSLRRVLLSSLQGSATTAVRTGKLARADDDALAELQRQVPGTQVHADLASFAEALIQQERAARGASGERGSGYGHLE